MKGFLVLVVVAATFTYVHSAATNEIKAKIKAAEDKCTKEHNIDEATVDEIHKTLVLPETEDLKCMTACFTKEMGYLHDNKFDLEAMEESNKHKFHDAEIAEKVNGFVKKCVEEDSAEEGECERSYKVVSCVMTHMKEADIPHPDYHQE